MTVEEKADKYVEKAILALYSDSELMQDFVQKQKKYAKIDFLAGYNEAMRWRDPIEDKPNAMVDVMVKAERKEQYFGQELKQIIYMTSCVSKRDGKFIHEGYTKGNYGADIYIKILGWRSLEMEVEL